MNEIMSAIYTRFNTTNNLKTALNGQMYPHEALQSASFPYGVYMVVSNEFDEDFGDTHEYVSIQFSLFSEKESAAEINTLYGHLKTLFDDQILTVSGYTMLMFKRRTSQLVRDPEQATWHYIVDYEIILEGEK